jgi:hypothetical protein
MNSRFVATSEDVIILKRNPKDLLLKRHLFKLSDKLADYLAKTKNNYRPLDPGWYLYKQVLNYKNSDKFNDEFIELIYVTLSAWNMNSRGARLSDFDKFKSSIKNNRDIITKISNYKIESLPEKEYPFVIQNLKTLFDSLILVYNDKPKLVTFSKTMHFLIPDLIVPIDRKYTLNYFFKNKNISKNYNRQFIIFEKLFSHFADFSSKTKLKKYEDNSWNGNIPKIIDNIIIGYGIINKF